MKKILLAYPVSDITIARYCAAMNVDYLIINLDARDYDKNSELINQVQEWVEGPEIILCSEDENKLQVFYSTTGLKTLLIYEIIHGQFQLDFGQKTIQLVENNNVTSESVSKKTFFIDDTLKIDEIINADAYLIQMGKEDKVGIYDFDRLDAIFEKIEEL